MAFRGVTTAANAGRHAFPPRSLLGRTQTPTSISGDIDAQAKYLLETVLTNAATLQVSPDIQHRKEYLSTATKHLMNKVSKTSASDYERLSKLRKAVRRHVKKDKRQHLCDHLLQDSRGPPSRQWNTLKFRRKPYVPRTQAVVDANGRPGSKSAKAAIVQHLSDNVWTESTSQDLPTTPLYPTADIPLYPFTEAELHSALHRMRHRRAPGPDQAPVELWKFAPRHFWLLLLEHYNQVFAQASSPKT